MSSVVVNARFAEFATELYERYSGLSLRERLLITVSVLSVTWMIWSVSIGGFLEESKVQIERDISTVYARMQAEVAKQTALETAKANDPNVKLGREREILGEELQQFTASMSSVLDRFVTPEQMPVLLEDIIRHHKGLKLTRMHSLPVETIVVGGSSNEVPGRAESASGDEDLPRVYKHPLRMEFEGDYFEVLAYLAELEASDWQFGWRRLEYVVADHPVAQITLEIETLSQQKSWIGV